MTRYLKLLRPHQYTKNGFVLLGVLFAGRWDIATLIAAAIVFVAFCAMSSAVYVLNDILDIDADRHHPLKKNRPLANGSVSVKTAWSISACLACIGLLLALAVSMWAGIFLLTYALLNIGYSWRWKHVVVLDVFIISAGFMLRIMAGTVGLGIPPSSWLLVCSLMLTLFLGFAKRRAELLFLENGKPEDRALTRPVLGDYSPMMIEQFMSISAACTILSYSLYTVSPETIAKHGTSALIYTVPIVVYGVFRYIFLLHKSNSGNDTASDLYTDPHLFIVVIAWIVTTAAILA